MSNFFAKIKRLLGSREKELTSSESFKKNFSDFAGEINRIKEVSPQRSAKTHGRIWKVRIKPEEDLLTPEGEKESLDLIEKELWGKKNKSHRISGRATELRTRVSEWKKRFEKLKDVGANVPDFIAPDYERKSLFFKGIPHEKLIDCADFWETKLLLRDNPETAEKVGEQLGKAHKAGFASDRDHAPLSSLFLVKEDTGYEPIFFDVMNLSEPLFWRKTDQKKELESVTRNLSKESEKRFLKAYKEENPEMEEYVEEL